MRFSVIIPIYNGEKFLQDSVGSVLQQTFQDYEVILVNDGSTDGSLEKCMEYQKDNEHVVVLDKKNGGQSSARNLGLSVATGEYIIFLDCDDMICNENFMHKLDSEIGKTTTDIIAYKYRDYFVDTGSVRNAQYTYVDLPLGQYEQTLLKMIQKDAFFCSAWSKCVRRELLVQNGILFDETSKCEDMDWYFQVINCASSIKALDEEMLQYRRHSGSVTTTIKYKNLNDYLKFINHWKKLIESSQICVEKEVLQNALAKLYVNFILAYLQCEDEKKTTLKKELYQNKNLLQYNLNPMVHKINLAYRIVGIRGVMMILGFLVARR